jgi:hypothetical protein
MCIQRNIEARLCNHRCSGKSITITYSECVFVVIGVQYALRMRCVILSFVTCLAVQYFSTLSHKRYEFLKSY